MERHYEWRRGEPGADAVPALPGSECFRAWPEQAGGLGLGCWCRRSDLSRRSTLPGSLQPCIRSGVDCARRIRDTRASLVQAPVFPSPAPGAAVRRRRPHRSISGSPMQVITSARSKSVRDTPPVKSGRVPFSAHCPSRSRLRQSGVSDRQTSYRAPVICINMSLELSNVNFGIFAQGAAGFGRRAPPSKPGAPTIGIQALTVPFPR